MKIKNNISFFFILGLIAFISILLSLQLGRYQIHFMDFIHHIVNLVMTPKEADPRIRTILFDIRLPRIFGAFIIGGTLSLTGATYQSMFRNPMVSPSILGVSAGSAFGASLAIILQLSLAMQQILSFISGIAAIVIVYLISLSTGKKHEKCLTLILSGMIVGTVFTALISVLKYVADPDETLPSIVYWLMGGLSDLQWKDLKFVSFISIVGLTLLSLLGWKLDMLSFGDDEAKTMGINVNQLRFSVIAIATLMTAASVSISGIIGWIGLLIPHISRMLIGSKNTFLLPSSFLIGGIFLLWVDNLSRSISSMEIPLGITTSLIGAPFFIFILAKTSKK